MNQTSPFVMTISRQLGAGGLYVGQLLAKKLNLFYVDREIIHKAAPTAVGIGGNPGVAGRKADLILEIVSAFLYLRHSRCLCAGKNEHPDVP